MALAGTPVDAELAVARSKGLIANSVVVVDGDDYETPKILNYDEAAADQGEDQNPGAHADPNVVQGPGEQDYNTPNPERLKRVRWIDGFNFLPDDCSGGHIVDPCNIGSGADDPAGRSVVGDIVGPIQPFIIEATDTASTWHPQAVRLARAERKFKAVRSKVLEAEFWNGTKAQSQGWTNNQYLTKTGGSTGNVTYLNGGGVFGFLDGLAALEQAIQDGSAWQRGAIHCTARVATHWSYAGLIHAVPNPGEGAAILTTLGTRVIVGSGYPGTGSDSHINLAHLEYAFASPIPQVRLGSVSFNQTDEDSYTVNRAANDRRIRISQFAAVTFSPCFLAGVLIDLRTIGSTPGS